MRKFYDDALGKSGKTSISRRGRNLNRGLRRRAALEARERYLGINEHDLEAKAVCINDFKASHKDIAIVCGTFIVGHLKSNGAVYITVGDFSKSR